MSPLCRSTFASNRSHIPKERHAGDFSLYLVANRPSYSNQELFFSKISAAVKGGVSCVQLRDYKSHPAVILKTAAHLKTLLKGTPLFINTPKPIEIALAVKADGVFLEEEIAIPTARYLLGQKAIIGISVKNMQEVMMAGQMCEIDYLSVKVSPSKRTCPRNDDLWGMDGLRSIRALSPHRIVAVGGLDLSCVESVYKILHAKDGIAMAGGLMEEDNPLLTAQKIKAIYQKVNAES